MRKYMLVAAILTAGCAAPPPAKQDSKEVLQDVGRRADELCSLPSTERKAALEKLKKETGLVIYCGK